MRGRSRCMSLIISSLHLVLKSESRRQEIEKTEEKALWSLLMPWELGRCAFEANKRHIDVRNVIWLGTSNIGHDLVFQDLESRNKPEQLMSREEYLNLMALLRPKVSKQLGVCTTVFYSLLLPSVSAGSHDIL
jgi:ATP-dependent Clp protease ATP-binding subunit ClpA